MANGVDRPIQPVGCGWSCDQHYEDDRPKSMTEPLIALAFEVKGKKSELFCGSANARKSDYRRYPCQPLNRLLSLPPCTPQAVRCYGHRTLCAMHETWEALTGQCDMGSYDPDLLAAAQEEATWLNDQDIVEYLKLCSLLGVRHRDGYAMFYKVIFSDRRRGLLIYDDEPYRDA